MKRIILLIGFISLLGCAGALTDVTIEKAYNSGQLRLGMTQAQVAQIIRPTYSGCVKQSVTQDGTWVLWDFATKVCGANLANSYVLIFHNDQLAEIRSVKTVHDMHLP